MEDLGEKGRPKGRTAVAASRKSPIRVERILAGDWSIFGHKTRLASNRQAENMDLSPCVCPDDGDRPIFAAAAALSQRNAVAPRKMGPSSSAVTRTPSDQKALPGKMPADRRFSVLALLTVCRSQEVPTECRRVELTRRIGFGILGICKPMEGAEPCSTRAGLSCWFSGFPPR